MAAEPSDPPTPAGDLDKLTRAGPPDRPVVSGPVVLRVRGIAVRVHPSWLLLFALLLVSLSAGWFPAVFPDSPGTVHWGAGAVTTLLLFASLLVHELSHSLVARRLGVPVHEITLFLFGGASRLEQEPATPSAEARIAAVGPLASLVLALLFGLLSAALDARPVLQAVSAHLAWVNLALAVFNLVPGFPMDGGRVLRALLWWRTGSLVKATRWAARVGTAVAVLLMILGALEILAGYLLAGVWLLVLGVFLRGLADQSYRATLIRRTLEGVSVRDLTVEDIETVGPDEPLDTVVDRFLRSGRHGLPVARDGQVLGLVTLMDIAKLPQEQRGHVTVGERMHPLAEVAIGADEPLSEALRRMQGDGADRLVVLRADGRLLGTVGREGVVELLQLRGAMPAR